jgi:hypothetical protein
MRYFFVLFLFVLSSATAFSNNGRKAEIVEFQDQVKSIKNEPGATEKRVTFLFSAAIYKSNDSKIIEILKESQRRHQEVALKIELITNRILDARIVQSK